MQKLGVIISWLVAVLYALSLILPTGYCLIHGCRGAQGDTFMPAFFLTPFGILATIVAFISAVRNIKDKHPLSGAYWPFAIVFASVLLGMIGVTIVSAHLHFLKH